MPNLIDIKDKLTETIEANFEKVEEKGVNISSSFSKALSDVNEACNELKTSINQFCQEHPYQTIGAALITGGILSLLLKSNALKRKQ